MADVIPLQGAVVEFSDGAATPNYTPVTGAESITWGDGEVSDIDTSTLESDAMEYSPGIPDFGSASLNFKRRNPNDPGQAAMAASMGDPLLRDLRITFSTGDVCTQKVYVKSMPYDGTMNNILTGSANLKVSGEPKWTTTP
ncbi:phage tail tube protein [Marinobacterium stanieri]|uniref:phage tail tube protein n=1 Tax=Marinobacterium stanieri TaxID=49186 RepID=UPI000255A601|nr:phage tail tube protein [Marinobacterium stanieri]